MATHRNANDISGVTASSGLQNSAIEPGDAHIDLERVAMSHDRPPASIHGTDVAEAGVQLALAWMQRHVPGADSEENFEHARRRLSWCWAYLMIGLNRDTVMLVDYDPDWATRAAECRQAVRGGCAELL
jgi:hypothetical protein